MELCLTAEQEAQLQQIAREAGTEPQRLAEDVLARYLGDAEFRSTVQIGLDQADRGEFLSEEEMDARLEQMLRC